jgi:hypothetical protein
MAQKASGIGNGDSLDNFLSFMNQGVAPFPHFVNVQDLIRRDSVLVSYAFDQDLGGRRGNANACPPIRPQARFELGKQSHDIRAFKLIGGFFQVARLKRVLQYSRVMSRSLRQMVYRKSHGDMFSLDSFDSCYSIKSAIRYSSSFLRELPSVILA